MSCKFCKIVEGEIEDYTLWEDDKFLLFLDLTPRNPGHSLLIPKKHVDYFFDLDDELYTQLFQTAKKLQVTLKKAMDAKRIGIAVVGFGMDHAHLHMVPLHGQNELFESFKSPEAKPEELKKVQEKIKGYFN